MEVDKVADFVVDLDFDYRDLNLNRNQKAKGQAGYSRLDALIQTNFNLQTITISNYSPLHFERPTSLFPCLHIYLTVLHGGGAIAEPTLKKVMNLSPTLFHSAFRCPLHR